MCWGALCSVAGRVTGACHERRHTSTKTAPPKQGQAAEQEGEPTAHQNPATGEKPVEAYGTRMPHAMSMWRLRVPTAVHLLTPRRGST